MSIYVVGPNVSRFVIITLTKLCAKSNTNNTDS